MTEEGRGPGSVFYVDNVTLHDCFFSLDARAF